MQALPLVRRNRSGTADRDDFCETSLIKFRVSVSLMRADTSIETRLSAVNDTQKTDSGFPDYHLLGLHMRSAHPLGD